ncbi:MAG TPA: hypothetical protein ENI53_02015, partial [Thermoplasmatales archaeon]|nr:hypothetical protein [Thermoplasmatales archaeon]
INFVEVKAKNVETIHINKKIVPAMPPLPLNMQTNEYKIEEGEIYEKDEFYPSDWFDYNIGMGIKNGKHVVFLSIHLYPALYNAVRNEIIYADDFDINIEHQSPSKQLFLDSEYDFLVITPQKWENALQTLKEHKDSHGIRTLILTTEEIYSRYNGRDSAEKIKYAIKGSIEEYGIKYVMLVGDADNIPDRQSYVPSGSYEKHFPSDLYYADIYFSDGSFSSWDSNNNNRFGEYKYDGNTDTVDLYPDVAIGRITCSTDTELNTIIQKIINYEKSVFGSEWFSNILTCGGDTFTPDDGDSSGVYEGEYMNQLILNTMSDFNGIKLWASLGNLSKGNIKNAINEGVGFVDFSGHGNRVSWATHPPLNSDEWIGYTMYDIPSLSNGNKLPVVIIDACSCGKFDEGDCFAGYFVEKSGGGAIASLAASGIGYGIPGYPSSGVLGWMEYRFFTFYRQKDILGDIWTSSLNGYLNTFHSKSSADIKTVEEWTVFGDPTLKIGGYSSEEAVVYIEKPISGYLYINDKPVMSTLFGNTIVIGNLNIEVTAYNVDTVEFYIDGSLKNTDTQAPFSWTWDERALGRHTLKVIGRGIGEDEDEISVFAIKF